MGITYQSYLYRVKYSKGYLSYNFKYICMCNLITIAKLSNTIHSQDHKFPVPSVTLDIVMDRTCVCTKSRHVLPYASYQ